MAEVGPRLRGFAAAALSLVLLAGLAGGWEHVPGWALGIGFAVTLAAGWRLRSIPRRARPGALRAVPRADAPLVRGTPAGPRPTLPPRASFPAFERRRRPAGSTARQEGSGLGRAAAASPLGYVAAALATGLVAGLLLPATRYESRLAAAAYRRWLGPHERRLRRRFLGLAERPVAARAAFAESRLTARP